MIENRHFDKELKPIDYLKKRNNVQSSIMTNNVTNSKITRLAEYNKHFNKQIQQQQQLLEELEGEIKFYEEQLKEKRNGVLQQYKKQTLDQSSVDISKIQQSFQAKQNLSAKEICQQLEILVEKLTIKLNSMIALNKTKRKEIDKIREEKLQWMQISEASKADLLKDLQTQKAIKVEFQQSQDELAKGAQVRHEHQNRLAERKKNQDSKVQAIYEHFRETNMEKYKNKNYNSMNFSTYDYSREQKNQKSTIGQQQKKLTQMDLDRNHQKLEKYQRLIAELQEKTQKNNIIDILEEYEKYKSQNMSYFIHMMQLNDSIEFFEQEKKQIESEIDNYQKLTDINLDPKKKKLELIKSEIAYTNQQLIDMQQEEDMYKKIFNGLKIQIPVIFERLGCYNEDYIKQYGQVLHVKDINERNIPQFLGIIEKRANEILQMHHKVFENDKKMENRKKEVGQISAVNQITKKQLFDNIDETMQQLKSKKLETNQLTQPFLNKNKLKLEAKTDLKSLNQQYKRNQKKKI